MSDSLPHVIRDDGPHAAQPPEAPPAPIPQVPPVVVVSTAVSTDAPTAADTEATLFADQEEITFPDGNKYKGELRDGKPHGQGIRTSDDGSVYCGEFFEGKRHGVGEATLPRCTGSLIVKGTWFNDNEHGLMEVSSPNGYWAATLEFNDGIPKAKGTIKFCDGRTYQGEIQGWEPRRRIKVAGEGEMTAVTGSRVYRGEFVDGKRQGHGVLRERRPTSSGDGTWTMEVTYAGEWADDWKHGVGYEPRPAGGDGPDPVVVVYRNGFRVVDAVVDRNDERLHELWPLYRDAVQPNDSSAEVDDIMREYLQTVRVDLENMKTQLTDRESELKVQCQLKVENSTIAVKRLTQVQRTLARVCELGAMLNGVATYRHAVRTATEAEKLKQNVGRCRDGTCQLGQGCSYRGELLDGIPQGVGTLTFPNGAVYRGQLCDGEMHGEGEQDFGNGTVLNGQWKYGKRHGLFRMSKGHFAEAEITYEEGVQVGDVLIRYHDGRVYQGEPVGLHAHEGTMTAADGSWVYRGEFVDGKRQGHGVLRERRPTSSGDGTWTMEVTYAGVWSDDRKHGVGYEPRPAGGDGPDPVVVVYEKGLRVANAAVDRNNDERLQQSWALYCQSTLAV